MISETGKIVYREISDSAPELSAIAQSLGYEEEGKRWFVYRIPRFSDKNKAQLNEIHAQYYYPVYRIERVIDGKHITEEKPKLLSYVFVLADMKQVDALRTLDEINPIYTHRAKGEILASDKVWMTVPNQQMHALMMVAEGYEKEVEFLTPDDQMLDKGDKVRVIRGRLKGTEGILLTDQGKKGGKVLIKVTNFYVTSTVSINEEDIQVLSFSRNTNHFYYKVLAAEKILNEALQLHENYQPVTDKMRASLEHFLLRYACVEGLSHVNEAKLTACRYAALRLLNQPQKAAECLKEYEELVVHSKSRRRAERRSPSGRIYLDTWVQKLNSVMHY